MPTKEFITIFKSKKVTKKYLEGVKQELEAKLAKIEIQLARFE